MTAITFCTSKIENSRVRSVLLNLYTVILVNKVLYNAERFSSMVGLTVFYLHCIALVCILYLFYDYTFYARKIKIHIKVSINASCYERPFAHPFDSSSSSV